MTVHAEIVDLVDEYGWDDILESLMQKAYQDWQRGEYDADLYNALENVWTNYLPDEGED